MTLPEAPPGWAFWVLKTPPVAPVIERTVTLGAKSRASLALTATCTLPPQELLQLVKDVANTIKGGGASLLTTGIQNLGAQVNVVGEEPGQLHMSISSGRQLVKLCTFSALVMVAEGTTSLQLGGLTSYRTSQSTFLFIPVGPKLIAGMAPYKRFLDEVAHALQLADPHATASIGERL